MKRVRLGSALALLAIASGCGAKAETQASEPAFNMPAAPPPARGGGTPPRRFPAPPPVAPLPQTRLPGIPPSATQSSEAMPRQLVDAGAQTPAVGDVDPDVGVIAQPQPAPSVAAVDAGSEPPPVGEAVDAGPEPPSVGAVDDGPEPPPVGAVDAGAGPD